MSLSRLAAGLGVAVAMALVVPIGCATDGAEDGAPAGGDATAPSDIVDREPDGAVEEAPPSAKPAPGPAARTDGATPELIATYREALVRQGVRLKHLQFLDSRGVVEIRYSDKDGKHFEQCDLRLYAMLPAKTALRLTKLDQVYAWIGSDDDRWWVYRRENGASTLEVHAVNAGGGEDPEVGFSVVSPRSILLLAGLAPLPSEDAALLREEAGALVVETAATARPRARWTLERGMWLPVQVDLLDDAGAVVASGKLSDYATAPADGVGPNESPKVPQRIEVARTDGSGSVRLSLERPTARADGVKPRFFDLKELQILLRPDELIWRSAPTAPTGPTVPTGSTGP